MACPRSALVDQFVAGQLDELSILAMEAHIEECEECFLRMAAAASEVSKNARASLTAQSTLGSRLDRCLKGVSFAETTLEDEPGSHAGESSRKTVGPYLITGFLGVGGMSVVYRAQHQVTGHEVAIKTVKMPFVASSLAMLRQEIEFLCEAQHPAIVSVLESDLMADDPWYAMELFEGPTLQEFNRRLWRARSTHHDVSGLGPVAQPPAAGGHLADALRLFARLCEPVGFIHGAGMVHGDIKPSNVFLRGEEQPVLMDFGLASRARGTVGREALDVTGRIRGTLPYIAPETIRGKLPDARADLYALGCMIYESVVGAPPFMSSSGTKIIDMHLGTAPVPASQRVSGVPAELDQLLLRLLAKNPSERFGHASALGASLVSIADSLSASPPARSSVVISSEATMPLFRPPMVGRDIELGSILGCVHRAGGTSSGTMFLVSGESGIGKTFFTAEVAQRALLTGVQVITSECVPLAPTSDAAADAGITPLQGFRRFFESLRDRCHERGHGEVERLFGGRLALLTNYLPVLRHLRRGGETEEPPPSLPAAAARERIVAAVVDTIVAYASDRSLLLALDDLQWADDLTLAVLDRLDDELFGKVPLIVLGTYRSDEAQEGLRRIARKPSTRTLHLGRLGRTDIGAMVGGMLSMSAPPEALVEYVHLQAEGVPFFAAEYLRALVAAGALVYRAGAWSTRAGNLEPLDEAMGDRPLPKTLRDIIRRRLDRLAPEVVDLLEAGAVLGRRFSLSLIGRMAARPTSDLTALLATAVAAQITNSDGFDGYTFLHDKIREALYAGLASERRARLHLDAAHAMEEGSATPPDQYGQIGHHLRSGGQPLQAIDYFEKAGAHALAMAANADADRFFRDVLGLEASLTQRHPTLRRARWLRQRGEALRGLGMMTESATAFKASAALLGRPFPTSKSGFAFNLAREILRQLWHRVGPRKIRRARLDEVDTNAEIVHVFERLHEVSFYLGRDADLILSTTVSLNASERAGPTPSLTVAYSNAAMMAGVLPLPKLADRYFSLAAAAGQAAPDPSAESWLMEMEGHLRTWQGNRARAIACLDRAIELARQGGFFRRADEAESVRTGLDLIGGLHGRVLERADSVHRNAHKRRDPQVQCWTLLQKAEAYLIRGDFVAALNEVTRAQALLPLLGRPELIWATGVETYIRHVRGERDLAQELLERGIALARSGPPVHSYCVGACDRMAEVAVSMCRAAPNKAALRARVVTAKRACAILERAARAFAIARPATSLHRGALDLILRRRRPAKVIDGWRQAAATAGELTMRHHELRLHAAILGRTDEADARWAETLGRVRELARELELGPGFETSSLSTTGAPLDGGVEVERKGEQPLA